MSEPTPPPPTVHELRDVADFIAIPAEKIDACLIDFWGWLAVMREVMNRPDLRVPETFRWIDDGKHFAHVTISHRGKIVDSASGEFAPEEHR